ncbi:MAG: 1,2-phenylacetyl-CoA epoxidase subunit PaaD [Phycisphaerae bacterium]
MTRGDGVTTRPDADDLRRVWDALSDVKDPEIPSVSLVELGMVPEVLLDAGRVVVRMLPTFAGCPALDTMREQIEHAVRGAGFEDVRVEVVFDPPWSTDRITTEGLAKLKAFGLAPPRRCGEAGADERGLKDVACPYCGSTDTALESIFGPTLCRAIHYCNDCRQSFEQFKPV